MDTHYARYDVSDMAEPALVQLGELLDGMQIARTLEKVEDMDVESLAAGIPWDFTTFPEYLASVDRHGTALNFAAYVGHTPLRIYVMGDDASSRTATPEPSDSP